MYLRLIELCLGIQPLFYTFICKRQQLTKAIFLFRKVAQKIKTNFGILSNFFVRVHYFKLTKQKESAII